MSQVKGRRTYSLCLIMQQTSDTSQPSHDNRRVPSRVTAEEKHFLFTSFEVQHFKILRFGGVGESANVSPVFFSELISMCYRVI